ncbi:MAG TPA: DUF507 domain-containing protein [Deltaproteobacteria bacterium]|nr:MAG: hypothetical protein A2X88_05125 [Deltaproteobacteria bacterium GWC2_65_14]HBO69704.1 DUF507 domain-containing protein [Deltaproteobacteria bacterium]
MRLTEDRISHLARRVIDRLYKDDLADFPDEGMALREAKGAFADYVRAEDEIDTFVRRKIAGLSRRVPEGGREWDILYRKYFEEEMAKKKM